MTMTECWGKSTSSTVDWQQVNWLNPSPVLLTKHVSPTETTHFIIYDEDIPSDLWQTDARDDPLGRITYSFLFCIKKYVFSWVLQLQPIVDVQRFRSLKRKPLWHFNTFKVHFYCRENWNVKHIKLFYALNQVQKYNRWIGVKKLLLHISAVWITQSDIKKKNRNVWHEMWLQ